MIRLKIVLLGDMAVGKTSYMLQLVNNKFFNYMDSTIGAAFSTKIMEIDNKQVKIEFWDTAGQERYRSLISMYYNNADAALIFYDINRIDTLDKWNIGIAAGSSSREEKLRGNLDGWIDEVRVYNRALSADEVRALYAY